MLRYLEVALSHREIPGETALCIYLAGCPNRCVECHYPELQDTKTGDILCNNFADILDLYHSQATCVCFMGESAAGQEEVDELQLLTAFAKAKGFKIGLYSGRDVDIESWMRCFDYVKLGSYQKDYGPLDCPTTNQRMYQQIKGFFVDITSVFWADSEMQTDRCDN